MIHNKKIGLSLSGGGYRATAYHLGTLKKLKELNVLDKVDIISTNSGGSITGATYGLYGHDYDEFEQVILKGVKSSVIKGVLTSGRFLVSFTFSLITLGLITYFLFTPHEWISFLLLVCFLMFVFFFQFQLFPISKLNEKMYSKFFFKGKTLQDLSEKTNIAINATNLETGRLFTFSRTKMTDSSYDFPKDGGAAIEFEHSNFPLARAVAASTSVPFVFTPVKIANRFYKKSTDIKRVTPCLVDGGVYDNQGAHKITQSNSSYACDIVVISDAGNVIPFKHRFRNTLTLLIRTSDIFMNRIKNIQMSNYLYQVNKADKKEIAYQSLGWDLENAIPNFIKGIKKGVILDHVLDYHTITKEDIEEKRWGVIENKLKENIQYNRILEESNTQEELSIARSVSTNLVALKEKEIDALIRHASCITEIQVRLYCPTLID
ncbi:NTE family protein [Aquimarina sp. MAR_2010_214]|uniref:patatin-like phospholipase family protein n=1 Tax=Aquimarina sp. MAR_2010_214 TaxID=1250026 RepID=UPI000C70A1D5|nr:patatin-like phospholipase family protein [Aquimarina sp. MAR_2010_214]PKV50549.1 NTE family protein [Aquimarina sp. MAR_2010_214]